jgi:hypothetical protein
LNSKTTCHIHIFLAFPYPTYMIIIFTARLSKLHLISTSSFRFLSVPPPNLPFAPPPLPLRDFSGPCPLRPTAPSRPPCSQAVSPPRGRHHFRSGTSRGHDLCGRRPHPGPPAPRPWPRPGAATPFRSGTSRGHDLCGRRPHPGPPAPRPRLPQGAARPYRSRTSRGPMTPALGYVNLASLLSGRAPSGLLPPFRSLADRSSKPFRRQTLSGTPGEILLPVVPPFQLTASLKTLTLGLYFRKPDY